MCQASQDGSDGGSGSWTLCRGALGGRETSVQLDSGENRLQVLVFYESDWDPSSLSLLTQFSLLKDQLLANNCSLYGCSTDTVATHLQWIKAELGGSFNFPLISDPAGVLADKFSLYDIEERLCLKGVVVVDSKGEQIETIVSGLEEEELAKFTLNIVEQVGGAQKPQAKPKLKVKVVKPPLPEVQTQAVPKQPQSPQKGEGRQSHRSLDSVWGQVVSKEQKTEDREQRVQRPVKPWVAPPVKEEWPVEQVRKRSTSGRTWGSPVGNKCPACDKAVYPLEQVFAADRKPFHKPCIDCQTAGCKNKLTVKGLHKVGGLVVCSWCDNEARMRVAREKEEVEEKESGVEQERRDQAMKQLRQTLDSKR